jgi:hypothetical protein
MLSTTVLDKRSRRPLPAVAETLTVLAEVSRAVFSPSTQISVLHVNWDNAASFQVHSN